MTYAESGVDISKGERFAQFIRSFPSRAVMAMEAGFAGQLPVDLRQYDDPVVLTTTDGVGTKLLIAKKLGVYDTVGIDLVAMCANDLIVRGARPVAFLDYIACGRLDLAVMQEVMKGVIAGCEEAGCVLTGGETAEHPEMSAPEDFDLAGFAVGVAERSAVLPKPDLIGPGDSIFGLPSSGVHSNGLSLARNVLSLDSRDVLETLLTPTRIYADELLPLIGTGWVSGAAHITGGGLTHNIPRILPPGLTAELTYDWPVPPIFGEIQSMGRIDDAEMRQVFNLGVGIAFVVPRRKAGEIMTEGTTRGFDILDMGVVRG